MTIIVKSFQHGPITTPAHAYDDPDYFEEDDNDSTIHDKDNAERANTRQKNLAAKSQLEDEIFSINLNIAKLSLNRGKEGSKVYLDTEKKIEALKEKAKELQAKLADVTKSLSGNNLETNTKVGTKLNVNN